MLPFSAEGKRFLITHTLVHHIMGSTVMVLELADHLQSVGADVTVFAAHADQPARSWFDQRGIPIVTEDGQLRLEDYDYVWVNSQVLPESFIHQLSDRSLDQAPPFIFNHMSADAAAPDEHPYVYELEQRLSSLSVFVAPETLRKLLPYYSQPPVVTLYPNPAPVAYCDMQRAHASVPQRFLVVSNHGSPEVEDAKQILRHQGHEVVHLGHGHDRYELLSAELLGQFDVAIAIGKTVQYCLVSGTPIFVYDHFGGQGYLTGENFEYARARNFSGRGGGTLSSEEIVSHLVAGYSAVVEYQRSNRAAFIERFGIAQVLPAVLGAVEHRTLVPFEPDFELAAASAARFAYRYYRSWGYGDWARSRIAELEAQNGRLAADVDALETSRAVRFARRVSRW